MWVHFVFCYRTCYHKVVSDLLYHHLKFFLSFYIVLSYLQCYFHNHNFVNFRYLFLQSCI